MEPVVSRPRRCKVSSRRGRGGCGRKRAARTGRGGGVRRHSRPRAFGDSVVGSSRSSRKRDVSSLAETLFDSEKVYSSFRRGEYCSSTGLNQGEWEIMNREFLASGLIVKDEPDSD